jgi:divalent metal cation (Fe/Co/Zn/Cd) transporter
VAAQTRWREAERSITSVVVCREAWSAVVPTSDRQRLPCFLSLSTVYAPRRREGSAILPALRFSRALSLSLASVCTGALIGTLSVSVGIVEASVSVLGTGLGLLADLAGSVVLVWRFHAERRHAVHAERVERRAAAVVMIALALVSVVITADAVRALVDHGLPRGSWLSLVTAGIALTVLTPLALAKRRTAADLGSHALRGDS